MGAVAPVTVFRIPTPQKKFFFLLHVSFHTPSNQRQRKQPCLVGNVGCVLSMAMIGWNQQMPPCLETPVGCVFGLPLRLVYKKTALCSHYSSRFHFFFFLVPPSLDIVVGRTSRPIVVDCCPSLSC